MTSRFQRFAFLAIFCSLTSVQALALNLKGWVRETADYPQHQGLVHFFDRLKALSQDRFIGQVICCEELGGQAKVVPLFKKGEVDVVLFFASALSNDLAEMNVLSLPFLFRDPAHMMSALKGEVGAELQNMLAAKGYQVLTWYDGGSRSFYSRNKSLTYASDFKGQTIRVANKKDHISMVEALGGKPSTLAFDKLPTALKAGEIDIAENDLTSYFTSEHYKVAPHYTFSHHAVLPIAVLVSTQRWQSLSESDKGLFRQAALESAAYAARMRAERDADIRSRLEKAGVKFYPFRSASTAISQMKDTYTPVISSPKATELMMKIMTTQTASSAP